MPPMRGEYRLEFHRDVREFLAIAGDALGGAPVRNTVITAWAEHLLAMGQPVARRPREWWLTVHDDRRRGAVVGMGMRTMPRAPYTPYLLAMPAAAARDLATVLLDRDETVAGINGDVDASAAFAEEYAARTRASHRVTMHVRQFRLDELRPGPARPGRIRVAQEEDTELAVDWFDRFGRDMEVAGGRQPVVGSKVAHEDVVARVRQGRVRLWVDARDRPVSMCGHQLPAAGVVRVGPVFTPGAERGKGYAGAAVAALCAEKQAEGFVLCLQTDQANPVSNGLYVGLGFVPVGDMVERRIARAEDGWDAGPDDVRSDVDATGDEP